MDVFPQSSRPSEPHFMAIKRPGSALEEAYPSKSPRSASDHKTPFKSHQSGGQLPGSKKLVMFCNSVKEGANGFANGFEVYVVDLDLVSIYSSSSPPPPCVGLTPRIQSRWGWDTNWVGCVLNSTIYIFEECQRKCEYVSMMDTNVSKVMKFDLSLANLDSYEKEIDINKFQPVTSMKHPKYMPIAVPTPDGKRILVFQTVISVDTEVETCFELYDPSEDAWIELEPPAFPKKDISVQAYLFIDNSHFVLISWDGIFVLHLNSEKKEDHLPDLWGLGDGIKCYNSVTIGNRVISIGWASVIGNDIGRDFALSSPIERSMHDPLPFIALLEHKDGDGDAYTLVSHTQSQTHALLIDVCRTDLESLDTTVTTTLKYILDPGSRKAILSLSMFII